MNAVVKGGQNGVLCVNWSWAPLLNHMTYIAHMDTFSFFYKGKQPVSSNFGAEWDKVCLIDSLCKFVKMDECSL